MRGAVRTVLGDVPPEELGATDCHEHLFQVSPLLPGDELDDEERSGQEAALLRAAGITAMIDATPIGLGRDPAALARISARTGLAVVASTGVHREAHYPEGHGLRQLPVEELARWFVRELTSGMTAGAGSVPVRAGQIKAGIGYWSISPFERRTLEAAALAHGETGAPIMVHLEHGSAGFEVLGVLGAAGVPASRVTLAHIDRNPDAGLHAELAAAGAYLEYDGMARHREWPDSMIIDCLLDAAERGAAHRLLLGGDVARRTRYVAYGGLPGLAYLPERFVPRLEAAAPELTRRILVDNPARYLAW
ncbi:phosphotriesterase family protein [Nonomuraea jiangxiensis]|uniref:Phosphotriesterase-related protein n=1 Tax=Nonomuraea jiangxiensis TaxID=633440 RepID=A0A1G8QJ77_9ACTN|nr:aryldialkylphosphatase [Nonomuraea jiangxiensis]SDJ04844.1 phosphotriesterase-related protein [Nonomuraea jiangxiensis]